MIGLSYFLRRAIALQPCQELSSRIMQLFSIKQSSWKMLFPLQHASWSGVPKNDATRSVSPHFQFILVSLSSGGSCYPRMGVPAGVTTRDPALGPGAHGASRRGKGALGDPARTLCSVWRARRVRRESWQLKGFYSCARPPGCSGVTLGLGEQELPVTFLPYSSDTSYRAGALSGFNPCKNLLCLANHFSH